MNIVKFEAGKIYVSDVIYKCKFYKLDNSLSVSYYSGLLTGRFSLRKKSSMLFCVFYMFICRLLNKTFGFDIDDYHVEFYNWKMNDDGIRYTRMCKIVDKFNKKYYNKIIDDTEVDAKSYKEILYLFITILKLNRKNNHLVTIR